MVYIEVISGVGFGEVFVRATQVPLTAPRAGVISRCGYSEHSIHGEETSVDILPVEIPAKTDLFDLEFVGAEDLG